MPKQKWNLNITYISERLRRQLRPISRCALTTVIAPAGYGKTTAVNWYLHRAEQDGDALVIRISIYSDSLPVFWKSAQNAFKFAGYDFLDGCECHCDPAGAGLLIDDMCHRLRGGRNIFIYIDDFHLLRDRRVTVFLCTLAGKLPENVHLVTAGRDSFLSGSEILRLGNRLHRISTDDLRLDRAGLSVYARRCGAQLDEDQIDSLLGSSEGWFSAVYLDLCTLAETGRLPDSSSDIYGMFRSAMIDPLPAAQQKFLAVMGLADEFTGEMARYVTGDPDTCSILTSLTEQNAFVTRIPGGDGFRFHHVMKECARREFNTLDDAKQHLYMTRFAEWYEEHGQYLKALSAYAASGCCEDALRVIRNDAGILLASLEPADVMDFLENCPEAVLRNEPLAILVLMRRLFTWRQIPGMLKLRDMLVSSVDSHPEMTDEERGNLLGECDLIMSFLMYNDIAEMSRLHRSASAQMSRPAVSIRNEGSWTFGSPSVLMMFHRTPGALCKELAEMNECMPHYYKITSGHGEGAELLMSAEAAFMQGRLTDARIGLEHAFSRIADNGQRNISLCCDFLDLRLSLCEGSGTLQDPGEKRPELIAHHNMMWLNIFDSSYAYYFALLGNTNRIPEFFREHQLKTVSFLSPCRPMMEMIENQVFLAQGGYAKVIGRSENLISLCENHSYSLVRLHIMIQTAAAYEMLGKRDDAAAMLDRALSDARPDGLIMPFVENYRYLGKLLDRLCAAGGRMAPADDGQAGGGAALADDVPVGGVQFDGIAMDHAHINDVPVVDTAGDAHVDSVAAGATSGDEALADDGHAGATSGIESPVDGGPADGVGGRVAHAGGTHAGGTSGIESPVDGGQAGSTAGDHAYINDIPVVGTSWNESPVDGGSAGGVGCGVAHAGGTHAGGSSGGAAHTGGGQAGGANDISAGGFSISVSSDDVGAGALFISRIRRAGRSYEQQLRRLTEQAAYPAALSVLTDREREIAFLTAAHLSNREIAGKLFLSEGTVKQYMNQIYSKLMIEGDPRTRRKQLIETVKRRT